MGKLSMNLRKLNTHEDRFFVHKTLGILAVVHFIYRYLRVLPKHGHLNFQDGTRFDWACMMMHTALSCSSLVFHVLAKRILEKPMVIWEEYRLHAIVFSLRCLWVYMFPFLWTALGGPAWEDISGGPVLWLLNAVLCGGVLCVHLVVDEITRRHGSKNHTTVRVDRTSTWYTTIVLRFYSFYQFLALGSHLIYHPQYTADLGFNTLVAIQSSAFLMTLYRKSIISNYTHGIIYSLCLIFSSYVILGVAFPSMLFFCCVLCCFVMRVKFRINKYALWVTFFFVYHGLNTNTIQLNIFSAAEKVMAQLEF